MLHAALLGIGHLVRWPEGAVLLFGVFAGLIIGILPGVGGIPLLALTIPFLFGLSPTLGLPLLLAENTAVYMGSSITAILLNAPGAPESVVVTLDGHAMAKAGKAARALGISAAASTLGAWVGVLLLLFMIPLMEVMFRILEPPEYFMLALLGIVMIGQLGSGSMTKGLLSGLLGMMLSFVGFDPVTGTQRFTFNLLSLYNGFGDIPVVLGVFAVAAMLELFIANRSVAGDFAVVTNQIGARAIDGVRDVFNHFGLFLRSSVLGALLGLVPGVGGVAANFLAYAQARHTSRHGDAFGSGVPEGVIAPEAASIAKEAGSLIPTVALGIPGTAGMAVLLGGFLVLGVEPGPQLVSQHLDTVFSLAWTIAIGSLVAALLGLSLARVFARVTSISGTVLFPFILVLAFLGSFESTRSLFSIGAMVVFAALGVVLQRLGYSTPGFVVGFILGSVAEHNLFLAVSVFGWHFLTRPLTVALLVAVVAVLALPSLRRRHAMLRTPARGVGAEIRLPAAGVGGAGQHGAGRSGPVSAWEAVLDAFWLGFSIWYLVTAISFPSWSRVVPSIIGAAAVVTAGLQFAGVFWSPLSLLTHGRQAGAPRGARPASPESLEGNVSNRSTSGRAWRSLLWLCALFASVAVLGYALGASLFVFGYGLANFRRQWPVSALSAAGVGLVIQSVFVGLLQMQVPAGWLPQLVLR